MKYGFENLREEQFPRMLVLEITNVCNYRCVHCPYTEIAKRDDYQPEFMDRELYEKIANETAVFKDTIFRFVCDGEPMMHPDFLWMIKYAKQKGISPVCVTTNGYFLTEDIAREMIECECDLIEVSLDAFSEETYKKIRVGGDFNRVVDNTLNLIKIRNFSKKKSKIIVSAIDQPLAKDELSEFKKYWEDRADGVVIRTLTSIGGMVQGDNKTLSKVNVGNRWPCPLLWQRLFINAAGFAEFCVDDWLDESIVGNLKTQNIADVWKSSAYDKLRHFHLQNEFTRMEKCGKCLDWPARAWDYNYFTALEKVFC
ncbi:MAG: radical SAM protein [PVC group bacterium]|nr:radical SAM protein [PVC group bacterium]